MRASKEELKAALLSGDLTLKNDSGTATTNEFNAYAALGYMDSSGANAVEFNDGGCPCIPGAPCFPECAEETV
jgi:hypothetical protein